MRIKIEKNEYSLNLLSNIYKNIEDKLVKVLKLKDKIIK